MDEHFGHCEYFTVFTIDDKNKILRRKQSRSPAGCGCKSNIAATLAQMGVKMMLAGNMGQGAVNVLGSQWNPGSARLFRQCQRRYRKLA